MVRRELRVLNRLGLHARAAARFVHLASSFKSRVRLRKNGTEIDGKSILGVLTLAAVEGTTLYLSCEGEDESQAADELAALVAARFGEEN